jgi:hypothetical protein
MLIGKRSIPQPAKALFYGGAGRIKTAIETVSRFESDRLKSLGTAPWLAGTGLYLNR